MTPPYEEAVQFVCQSGGSHRQSLTAVWAPEVEEVLPSKSKYEGVINQDTQTRHNCIQNDKQKRAHAGKAQLDPY